MSQHRVGLLLGIIVVISVFISFSLIGAADSDYSLSSSPSVGVPEQTVEHGGDTYIVTEIGRDYDDTIEASGEGPDDGYTVLLYNSDKQIEDRVDVSGEASFTFDVEVLDPGSYTLRLDYNGAAQTIHPIVIPAYDSTVNIPTTVTKGESLPVSTTISQIKSDKTIDHAEVVLGKDDSLHTVDISTNGTGSYQTNVSTGPLSTGTYLVYVVVRGTETTDGKHELIGLSDSQQLTIDPKPTSTSTSTSTTTSTSTSTSTPTSTSTTTSTSISTSTSTSTPTSTSSESTTTEPSNNDDGGNSGGDSSGDGSVPSSPNPPDNGDDSNGGSDSSGSDGSVGGGGELGGTDETTTSTTNPATTTTEPKQTSVTSTSSSRTLTSSSQPVTKSTTREPTESTSRRPSSTTVPENVLSPNTVSNTTNIGAESDTTQPLSAPNDGFGIIPGLIALASIVIYVYRSRQPE